MADTKKTAKRTPNLSKQELDLVKELVLKHPIIEKKLHDQKTESIRKTAWQKIATEFNAQSFVHQRTIPQLKTAWKRIKSTYKTKKAAERRSKFKTGGGPPSPTTEEDTGMEETLADQTPLEYIPDDDNDYEDDEQTVDDPTSVEFLSPASSSRAENSTTGGNTPSTTPPPVGTKKTHKKVVKYAEEFHKKRMEYLKLEHEEKMRVIKEELSYWQLKKRIVLRQEASHEHHEGDVEESSEQRTFQLFSQHLTN
ncbi:myb/SANT-like DNA-binding domain-containing protein 3 [Macrosteles quadrilineatus]|uniref:myb/SANT-like DNA-binding domain-containing protein 3 n=1 Tax=Macrosteles quadrilineatus TaxID=74068 RepID=UPI0023E1BE21|nr:myb/SANT-like DNA-binding domain-containing protein 3 [Macrosteles quadrilineatus]